MIRQVAMREIKARGASKSFIISTLVIVLMGVAATIAIAIITGGDNGPREVTVATATEFSPDTLAILESAEALGVAFEVRSVDAAELGALVTDGEADVGVASDGAVVWREFVDSEIAAFLVAALRQDAVINALGSRGIDRVGAAEILASGAIENRLLEPPDDAENVRRAVGALTAIVTFIVIQTFGSFVAMGVIEEKASRVIEILLAHLQPRELLAGKVLGLGVLAMTQAALLMAGLAGALFAVNDIEIPSEVWSAIVVGAIWMVLGFAFYAAALAAAGSLVSRTEDAQQVMLPVMLPMLIGYLVGVTSADASNSTIVRVLSYLPVTSPTVLPMRMAQGGVAPWEIAISVAGLLLGTWAVIRFAAKLYEFTLLRSGARIGWREAFRLGSN